MLKRQRQPSPSPPSSSVPLITNDPIADLIDRERDSKRRRTLPPALDGAARGWAQPQRGQYEDEEEDYSDDELEENTAFNSMYTHQNQTKSELYKSTNTMLRDLHTLHQHRLLFSSPSPSMPHVLPSLYQQNSNSNTVSTSYMSQPSPTKNGMALPLLRPMYMPTPIGMEKGALGQERISEEAEIVNERYENTNKLLGSLFLSRRRALDSSTDTSGT